ncbi:MBL fold metallo-hydrolase [Aquihabitans daechungensis]|uniref:MBL fold metallo-hydrolase n=1 Tax=Aquihabitans daechungensis TaxID=1052257 RepID=UPI003B9E8221
MTIEITLLGTGSPLPDPNRAGPSTLVRAGGKTFLFDAGRGVGLRLAAAGAAWSVLDAVLLTHLHSDHITDLNDAITGRWVTSLAPNPLPVIGPGSTQVVVDGILAMLGPDIGYRIAHHEDLTEGPRLEVTESAGGVVFEDAAADVRILAAPTDHRPVEPTLGYRVEHGGSAVVIGGDGVPCAGLDELCAGADAYVQTVLREDLVSQIPIQRFLDTIDYHSTVRQAGETAAKAGASTLVLTHQVPTPAPGSEAEWIAQAAEVFGGEIVFGNDLTVVTVGATAST